MEALVGGYISEVDDKSVAQCQGSGVMKTMMEDYISEVDNKSVNDGGYEKGRQHEEGRQWCEITSLRWMTTQSHNGKGQEQ